MVNHQLKLLMAPLPAAVAGKTLLKSPVNWPRFLRSYWALVIVLLLAGWAWGYAQVPPSVRQLAITHSGAYDFYFTPDEQPAGNSLYPFVTQMAQAGGQTYLLDGTFFSIDSTGESLGGQITDVIQDGYLSLWRVESDTPLAIANVPGETFAAKAYDSFIVSPPNFIQYWHNEQTGERLLDENGNPAGVNPVSDPTGFQLFVDNYVAAFNLLLAQAPGITIHIYEFLAPAGPFFPNTENEAADNTITASHLQAYAAYALGDYQAWFDLFVEELRSHPNLQSGATIETVPINRVVTELLVAQPDLIVGRDWFDFARDGAPHFGTPTGDFFEAFLAPVLYTQLFRQRVPAAYNITPTNLFAASFSGIADFVATSVLNNDPGNGDPRTWTVAGDGSGDHTTIQGAVDAAAPGDTIEISAGTYNESVTVAKDNLTLRAIGLVEITNSGSFGLRVDGSGVEVRGITVRGILGHVFPADHAATGFVIAGQNATLVDCIARNNGVNGFLITATAENATIQGGAAFDNTVAGVAMGGGTGTTIRGMNLYNTGVQDGPEAQRQDYGILTDNRGDTIRVGEQILDVDGLQPISNLAIEENTVHSHISYGIRIVAFNESLSSLPSGRITTTNLRLVRNHVHDNGSGLDDFVGGLYHLGGILIQHIDGGLVESNLVRNNFTWGIDAYYCHQVVFRNNRFINNNRGADTPGITIAPAGMEINGGTNNTVINNLVTGSHAGLFSSYIPDSGDSFPGMASITIENNLFFGNTEGDFEPLGGNDLFTRTIRNNVIGTMPEWLLSYVETELHPTFRTDNFYGVDPLFVDPANGDFSLQAGSPVAGLGLGPQADSGGEFHFLTLILTPPAGGTVTQSGPGTYAAGSVASLTAAPNPGYLFQGWSGDASGDALTAQVTMDAPRTVTATFAIDAADDDSDGLTNHQEIVIYQTNPQAADSSDDGILDGEAVTAGLDPRINQQAVIAFVAQHPDRFGIDQTAAREAGRQEVLADPMAFNLFSEENLVDLHFGGLLLRKSGDTISVDFTIQTSTDLSGWGNTEVIQRDYLMLEDQVFLRLRASPSLPGN